MTEAELRARVVAEARTWIGTPFHHQGRVKNHDGAKGGVDCIMLVRAVGEATGAMPRIKPAQERKYWRFYGTRPNPPVMRACLETFMVEIPEAEATTGDAIWMHWRENDLPIHMALIGDGRSGATLIHSILGLHVHEHTFDDAYRKNVDSYWRYPAIAAARASC